jgi:formylglycine-generating enzyme required for sulfatase activity
MVKVSRLLSVLISHSSKDQSIARGLYHQLYAEGWMDLWFIESNLKMNQNWDVEIRKAVDRADVVIILLSKYSAKREAYFYPDPGFVLDILETKPKKKVLIIPLRLDGSDLPTKFKSREEIFYFPKHQRNLAYEHLLDRLKFQAEQLGFSTERREPSPELEKSLQWSPSIWKKLAKVDFDHAVQGSLPDDSQADVFDEPERKSSKRIHLFTLRVIAGIFVVLSFLVLAVKDLVKNQRVDFIAVPYSSKAPTLAPKVPTPIPRIGSPYVSPKDGMIMAYIPAGEFMMGSNDHQDDEKPAHSVYLDAFWIDQYEVTNGMYAKCVEAKICGVPWNYAFGELIFFSPQDILDLPPHDNSKFLDQVASDPEFFSQPVTGVFWEWANAYCRWVGRRLPTEAEWEKAARGVDERIYPWGETADCTKANFSSCVGNPSHVGSYEAGKSPYGAYDMAGNAMEWVADWYDKTYYQISPYENPLGSPSGRYRVFRGGSWGNTADAVRSTNRPGMMANIPDDFIGFRCASSE